MPAITGQEIIADGLLILNVIQPGQTVPSPMAQFCLRFLNGMIGQWALMNGTIPAITREVWPLVAGKGGPSNLYTYGPGGDFDTTKAPSQSSFTGAMLKLGGNSPEATVYIPRPLLTDDQWQALQLPELTNAQFTEVFYDPTYTDGLGRIGLWPVPNTSDNALVLFRKVQLATFDLSTVVQIPEGYDEALKYNFAIRVAVPLGRQVPDDVRLIASTSMHNIFVANHKLTDVAMDPMFVLDNARGGYNINVGGNT